MVQQENQGRPFTSEQRRWLEMMRDHIATSVEMTVDDFDYTPFAEEGGRARAAQVFGGNLDRLLIELNQLVAA
jgi:type I restriction enzyme R subunit